jgi:hypothetical protein
MHLNGMSISYIALKEGQRCSINLQVALQERYFRFRVLKHISSKHCSPLKDIYLLSTERAACLACPVQTVWVWLFYGSNCGAEIASLIDVSNCSDTTKWKETHADAARRITPCLQPTSPSNKPGHDAWERCFAEHEAEVKKHYMQIQRSVVYERATIKLIEMLICFQHKASAQKRNFSETAFRARAFWKLSNAHHWDVSFLYSSLWRPTLFG